MRSILDLLIAKGTITDAQAKGIRNQSREQGKNIEEVLIDGGVGEHDILESKSELLGIPTRTLDGMRVGFDALRYIPEESARHYLMVPLGIQEEVLEVGMVNPENLEAREALQFISSSTNKSFKIFLISRSDLAAVLQEYRGLGGEVQKAVGEFEAAQEKPAITLSRRDSDEEEMNEKGELNITEDAPVTKMVSVILRNAVEGNASDVHVEPSREQLRVRFRVDGVLYTSIVLPMKVHDAFVSRVKIMTNLKIDEHRKPQDGRFRAKINNRDIDFRVSTFPTYYGEKVVIRILDPNVGVKTFEELGLDGRNLEQVKNGLKRPYGMILITGPTGSGKSTTLYAMLNVLNDEKRNIVSLEDPIEYYLQGINQSQIRPEINYTFASGLRSILRQDPDVIMVGEIRDKETAQLAVHAALTGHLVLSTLHTNDAVGVIPRLVDMGVDPFLIPSTLVLAIGQRLVRTLCEESRKEIKVEGTVSDTLERELASFPSDARKDIDIPEKIYEAAPSKTCPKGTRGRIAVFEVLSMTEDLEKVIISEPTESTISKEAARQGMVTMRQDGIKKVFSGITGLDELFESVV